MDFKKKAEELRKKMRGFPTPYEADCNEQIIERALKETWNEATEKSAEIRSEYHITINFEEEKVTTQPNQNEKCPANVLDGEHDYQQGVCIDCYRTEPQPAAVQADEVKPCGMCMAKKRRRCCDDAARFSDKLLASHKRIAELEAKIKDLSRADIYTCSCNAYKLQIAEQQAKIDELEIKLASKCEYHVEYNSPINVQLEESRLQIQAQKKVIEKLIEAVKAQKQMRNQWTPTKLNDAMTWKNNDELADKIMFQALQSAAELENK